MDTHADANGRSTMNVTILKTATGLVRVHASECRDVHREPFALAIPSRYDSLKSLIEDIYVGFEDLDEPDGWKTIAQEITVLPCCKLPTT